MVYVFLMCKMEKLRFLGETPDFFKDSDFPLENGIYFPSRKSESEKNIFDYNVHIRNGLSSQA